MNIRYTGNDAIHFMTEGKVWYMEKGDEVEVKEMPTDPNFEVVKQKKGEVE